MRERAFDVIPIGGGPRVAPWVVMQTTRSIDEGVETVEMVFESFYDDASGAWSLRRVFAHKREKPADESTGFSC